jgi:hypothetical protein
MTTATRNRRKINVATLAEIPVVRSDQRGTAHA